MDSLYHPLTFIEESLKIDRYTLNEKRTEGMQWFHWLSEFDRWSKEKEDCRFMLWLVNFLFLLIIKIKLILPHYLFATILFIGSKNIPCQHAKIVITIFNIILYIVDWLVSTSNIIELDVIFIKSLIKDSIKKKGQSRLE